mmetsp:Transcript_20776/g.57674  ORF Transcript_20776/g.57674 Transcript_20776/m.57674 type:complete len:357 (+) Transcript_20776:958-2028(+)
MSEPKTRKPVMRKPTPSAIFPNESFTLIWMRRKLKPPPPKTSPSPMPSLDLRSGISRDSTSSCFTSESSIKQQPSTHSPMSSFNCELRRPYSATKIASSSAEDCPVTTCSVALENSRISSASCSRVWYMYSISSCRVRIPSVWLMSMTSLSMAMSSTARRALDCRPALRTRVSRALLASCTFFSKASISTSNVSTCLSTCGFMVMSAGRPSSEGLTVFPSLPFPLSRSHSPAPYVCSALALSTTHPGFCNDISTLDLTKGATFFTMYFSSCCSPFTTAASGPEPLPTMASVSDSGPCASCAGSQPSRSAARRASPSGGSRRASSTARVSSCPVTSFTRSSTISCGLLPGGPCSSSA